MFKGFKHRLHAFLEGFAAAAIQDAVSRSAGVSMAVAGSSESADSPWICPRLRLKLSENHHV